jgi:RNA polymerase sigma-70 factor (ECF subfamily)
MEHNLSTVCHSSAFPPTQWTVIIEAGSTDPARAREALDKLCGDYRQPIVNWFKRKDFHQDPEDLAHGFVAYVLEKNLLNKVVPRTGRFRCFLVTAMQKFLWDAWDRNNAQKRGRDVQKVALVDNDVDVEADGPADSQLDMDFALVIHQRVMDALRPRTELKPYIFQKDTSERWDEIAKCLGKTAQAVRKEVSRLRRRHWEQFRDQVAQIVTPANRVEETRYLYELLFRNFPAE